MAAPASRQLMERAGAALAEAAYRFAGPMPALILCGPGNNGGDGYVAARHLAERGVTGSGGGACASRRATPRNGRAGNGAARSKPLSADTQPAPVADRCLVRDRAEARPGRGCQLQQLSELLHEAVVSIACDLPSGVETDSGAVLSPFHAFDMTVTFGALKPAHLPASGDAQVRARWCSPTSGSKPMQQLARDRAA